MNDLLNQKQVIEQLAHRLIVADSAIAEAERDLLHRVAEYRRGLLIEERKKKELLDTIETFGDEVTSQVMLEVEHIRSSFRKDSE